MTNIIELNIMKNKKACMIHNSNLKLDSGNKPTYIQSAACCCVRKTKVNYLDKLLRNLYL